MDALTTSTLVDASRDEIVISRCNPYKLSSANVQECYFEYMEHLV